MKRFIILLTCILFAVNVCTAQISFGPIVGFHLTSYNFLKDGNNINDPNAIDVVNGRLGVAGDFPFSKRFHFQTSVSFTGNGYYTPTPYGAESKFNVNAIEVPLLLSYHGGIKHQSHLFAGIGIYGAYNVGGKRSRLVTIGTGPSTTMQPANERLAFGADTPAHLSRIAAGITANAGYQWKRGMFVRIHYQMGLKNMYPNPVNTSYTVTSSNYGLTLGYFFHPKNKKERIEKASKPKPSY